MCIRDSSDSLYLLANLDHAVLLNQAFEHIPTYYPSNEIPYYTAHYLNKVERISKINASTALIEADGFRFDPDTWNGKVGFILRVAFHNDTAYVDRIFDYENAFSSIGGNTQSYYYTVDENGIHRYIGADDNVDGLSQVSLPIHFQTTSDKRIEKGGGRLLIWEYDSLQLYLHVTDTNLVDLNTYIWPINGNEIPVVGAALADSTWMIATYEQSSNRAIYQNDWGRGFGSYANFRTITDFDFLPTGPPLIHDLTISDIQYNEARTSSSFHSTQRLRCEDMYIFNYPEVEVTIRNDGLATVNKFEVIYTSRDTVRCGSICEGHTAKKLPFTTLQLAPGDSMTIPLPIQIINFSYERDTLFRIWLSAPYGQVYRETMSNLGCFSTTPLKLTSLYEVTTQ